MSKRTNTGFTLIELVIVLVLLGILAAVAAPRFLDLSGEAEKSAVQAQAGALASASAVNFAKLQGGGSTTTGDVETVNSCGDATKVVSNFNTSRFAIGGNTPTASFEILLTGGGTSSCTLGLD